MTAIVDRPNPIRMGNAASTLPDAGNMAPGAIRQFARFSLVGVLNTVALSFLGMRLWVFAQRATIRRSAAPMFPPAKAYQEQIALSLALAHHSISIVLPAYNEEQAIVATIADVLSTLAGWGAEFEVIVVDDGSRDQMAALIARMAARDRHIRIVTHAVNQGYGAALADGFAVATKDLICFMDADGQFAIADLARLLPLIDEPTRPEGPLPEAVLGYREHRQDSWVRLGNAWGWKHLVWLVLGVRIRDLDCAFKLLRTPFLHAHLLESRGALINAELLFRLRRAGATCREIGVRHLPRRSGQATGARPRVILQAIRDLLISAWRWRREGA